jgi:chromosome partitioning protein
VKTISDLLKYSDAVEALRQDILATEYPPDLRKTAPVFTASVAADILGVTQQTLQKIVRDGILEHGEDEKGRRTFTLEQIDDARKKLQQQSRTKDYFIARPKNVIQPFVLAICNLKGGSGKSTTAYNLAQYLSMKGYLVGMSDLDPQGSTTSLFGRIPFEPADDEEKGAFVSNEETLLNLFSEGKHVHPQKTYWHKLDLIPSNIRLFDTEYIMPYRQQNEADFQFHRVLKDEFSAPHYQKYDIILIDCPPSFSYLTLNSIFAADGLLVPCPPSHMDILATGGFFDQLNMVLEQIANVAGDVKTFDFILGLRTRMESDLEAVRNGSRIASVFGGDLIHENALVSKAVKIASEKNMSLYELNGEDIDSRTYKRAVESFNAINQEVLLHIIDAWNKKDLASVGEGK